MAQSYSNKPDYFSYRVKQLIEDVGGKLEQSLHFSWHVLQKHIFFVSLYHGHFMHICSLILTKTQDELEGTLRGHIGLIEEALDRLEGKGTEADRGKKMLDPRLVEGKESLDSEYWHCCRNEYYNKRGRDEKEKSK